MKKRYGILLAALLALSVTACGGKTAAEAFTIKVICESSGLEKIFYSCYLDDVYYAQGGMADLDGQELAPGTELELVFPKSYFEETSDISRFSIDFSPYGAGDTSEIMTTEKVPIAAEYGKTYTIRFSGDRGSGFHAELQEPGKERGGA